MGLENMTFDELLEYIQELFARNIERVPLTNEVEPLCNGMYRLELTAEEMNEDSVAICIQGENVYKLRDKEGDNNANYDDL